MSDAVTCVTIVISSNYNIPFIYITIAAMSVRVQCVTVTTMTHVAAVRVGAFVLTGSVTSGTFVDV